jgi:hypothetical protein
VKKFSLFKPKITRNFVISNSGNRGPSGFVSKLPDFYEKTTCIIEISRNFKITV